MEMNLCRVYIVDNCVCFCLLIEIYIVLFVKKKIDKKNIFCFIGLLNLN